jgi:hypothetical protein
MTRYAADIETDGFLPDLTRVHCLVLVDLDKDRVMHFADQPGHEPINNGLVLAEDADLLVFHNAIGFDVPAIQKVRPGWSPKGVVRDTLVLSRFVYPDIKRADFALLKKHPDAMPKNLVGLHSLKAWGYRLRERKSDYDGPWDQWSPQMHQYMIQDGILGAKLFRFLMSKKPPEEAVEMEHRFQEYLQLQQECGVPFDVAGGQALYAHLAAKRDELANGLRGLYQPWFADVGHERPAKERRYWTDTNDGADVRAVSGAAQPGHKYRPKVIVRGYWTQIVGPYTRVKLTEFNPSSRHHIADRLRKLRGWVPEEFTKDGHPKVDDIIISQLPYPEAPQLSTYLMVQKRIGQLAEGSEAWLRLVEKDGRIHGQVNGLGTATFRCTHYKPNLTQVPKVLTGKGEVLTGLEGAYGAECRGLFGYLDEDHRLVGADASGLELRMLAHYNYRYDDGRFMRNLLEGDIHAVNMAALQELAPNRDCSKTGMYALLYGAGDRKLGLIVLSYCAALGIKPPSQDPRKLGKAFRERLYKGLGIGPLMKGLAQALETRDWFRTIDGRAVPVRSNHSALNTLLQSSGSIVVKYATVSLRDDLSIQGYVPRVDWSPVLHAHDEIQLLTRKEIADDVGQRAAAAFGSVGVQLGCKCPLAGEYKVGRTWRDTH